jgi:3',5'-cyclic AMP phosphodiesterase CpdA
MTGGLSELDFELLELELKADKKSQLVIVLHHPPFEPGLKDFNNISIVEGSDRLAKLLRESGTPPIILCGHVHRPYFSRWNGANCFIGGSPAVRFGAGVPFGEEPVRPTNEAFSYFVHSLDISGHHVVTPKSISNSELAGLEVYEAMNSGG